MKTKRGFTLIELMFVVLIFSSLFAAVFSVFSTSDSSYKRAENQLREQQEARRAMDGITLALRKSSPDWDISGTHYNVTINATNDRLDFFEPIFDANGNLQSLRPVRVRFDAANNRLLKREGAGSEVVLANNVESVNFGGGCAGCAVFNCATVANDCPIVVMQIRTSKNDALGPGPGFTLNSRVTLRNGIMILPAEVIVEESGTEG